MIDSYYRTPYQKWIIDPLLKSAVFDRLTPKNVTLFGMCIGGLIPLFLALHQSFLALTALIISGFLDTLDGSLARHKKTTSPEGAILDIVADRFVEFAIILGLYLYAPEGRSLATLLMLGSVFLCVTTFLVVAIFEKNHSEKSFHYSAGLIERAEAFIFFSLMILLPSFFTFLVTLFTILVLITSLKRIKSVIKLF